MAGETQRILFAVGLGRGCILGYKGSRVFPAMTDADIGGWRWLGPDEAIPLQGYPADPGVYVWEGAIAIEDDARTASGIDVVMEGYTRPATPEDVAALLGKHDAPEPDDDGRDSPGV